MWLDAVISFPTSPNWCFYTTCKLRLMVDGDFFDSQCIHLYYLTVNCMFFGSFCLLTAEAELFIRRSS